MGDTLSSKSRMKIMSIETMERIQVRGMHALCGHAICLQSVIRLSFVQHLCCSS